MKKRLALIVLSLDKCFPKNGFSGGGFRVTQKLILGLINSGLFDIDIFAIQSNSASVEIEGINSVTIVDNSDFLKDLKSKIGSGNYDYVLSSDSLIPFANNLVHSNSSKYKSKNGKTPLMRFVLKFYNYFKIKKQDSEISREHSLFAVSERLRQDYIENFDLDGNKVFTAYPIGFEEREHSEICQKEFFTIGSIAGGGLNKGGYLLLLALFRLSKQLKKHKIRARFIYPKFQKRYMFKFLINVLGLSDVAEVLPQQKDMAEFFRSIDCYVLPSLNEALGLVVPESAMNHKPSIVSSTTGVCELISDNENGFVFNRLSHPVKNLAEKLSEVENIYLNDFDKYLKISENANKMIQNFSWDKFTEIIINNMVEEKHEL